MPKIKIMIVEDFVLIRQGLKQILGLKEDFLMVGESDRGDEVIEKVTVLQPDVVLMDIHLPGKSGIELTAELKLKFPAVKILALTIDADRHYLSDMIKAGASGCILKDVNTETLYQAIETVARGDAFIEPGLLSNVLTEFREASSVEKPAVLEGQFGLTQREIEIIHCIACGESNKVIAKRLFISEKTVKNHVSNILRKTGLEDRTQVAVYAYRKGLITK
jgi:DNA-binding NarL/FixJ family response regulator